MIVFDEMTGVRLLALLCLVLPINTWAALAGQRTLSAALWCGAPLAGGIGVVIALQMSYVLLGGFRPSEQPRSNAALELATSEVSNT